VHFAEFELLDAEIQVFARVLTGPQTFSSVSIRVIRGKRVPLFMTADRQAPDHPLEWMAGEHFGSKSNILGSATTQLSLYAS
jgi:hypothetical protein